VLIESVNYSLSTWRVGPLGPLDQYNSMYELLAICQHSCARTITEL